MDYNLLYQMSELCKENEIGFGIIEIFQSLTRWQKEIKWMTPFYRFEMRYRDYTDKKTIDVCRSYYKKFIKSVKTEVLDGGDTE